MHTYSTTTSKYLCYSAVFLLRNNYFALYYIMLQLYYNIINFFAALEYSKNKQKGVNLRLENTRQQY